MKTLEEIKEILKEHKKEIEEKYKVKEISIFGSYVRNNQRKESDIDILVVFEKPVSLLWLVKVENYLTDILGVKVDLIPKEDLRKELKDIILSQVITI